MRIYYIAYITTNLINNKEYIGVHTTNNLSDNYIGSGTVLKQAIRKYGRAAFNMKIITLFENAEYMFAWEAAHVTQEIVNDPMFYNRRTGGLGGYKCSDETRAKMSTIHKNISTETRLKMSIAKSGTVKGPLSSDTKDKISVANTGKRRTNEQKDKISANTKGKTRSSETRLKMSQGQIGTHKSEATRSKMSTSHLRRRANLLAEL